VQSVYKKYITTSVIVWAACFVLFVLAYVFLLGPQKETLNAKRQMLAKSDSDFKKATDAFTGVTKERLDKQVSQIREKLDTFALVGGDSSKLVVDLGQIASSLNVIGFSSKGQNDQSNGKLPMCKALGADFIYVSFKGNFSQFARFINELERHKPIIFVDKFTITRSDQGSFDNEINMVLAVFVCSPASSNSSTVAAAP
jgi:Tfp pilus assembly protein PilO